VLRDCTDRLARDTPARRSPTVQKDLLAVLVAAKRLGESPRAAPTGSCHLRGRSSKLPTERQ
jgi:hypothetical protein